MVRAECAYIYIYRRQCIGHFLYNVTTESTFENLHLQRFRQLQTCSDVAAQPCPQGLPVFWAASCPHFCALRPRRERALRIGGGCESCVTCHKLIRNNTPYDRSNTPYDRNNTPYDRTIRLIIGVRVVSQVDKEQFTKTG